MTNDKLKTKQKRRSLSFRLLCCFLMLFLVWVLLAWLAAEELVIEKSLTRADAILILGGSSVYAERTRKAAELYKRGIAPKILLTDDGERAGWSRSEQRNPPFVDLAKNELTAQGIPPEKIEILQPRVSGTFEEAQNLRKKVEETNLKSVLIVTSAYHTRRALWTFEEVLANSGETEIGIQSPPPGEQTPPASVWWLSPFGWKVVAGEYVKLTYYWLYY